MAVQAWIQYQRMMDEAVDGLFAEPVELHPWKGADYETEGGPDTARSVVKTTAIFVSPGAATTGEGGTGTPGGILSGDVWISIDQRNLGDLSQWRAGDRVYVVDRDAWWEMNAPPLSSATYRPNIHLVRIAGT